MRIAAGVLLACALAGGEPGVAERVAGMSEDALLRALRDDDWEVVHRAAERLGEAGTAAAIDPLVEVALRGPLERIRRAAAVSLGRLDAEKATERIVRRLRGDGLVPACEALAVIAHPSAKELLEKLLRPGREPEETAAVVRALAALRDEEHHARWTKLLDEADPRVQIAAVGALAASGRPEAVDALRTLLARDSLTSVVERRAIQAVRDLLAALGDGAALQAELCVDSLAMATNGETAARLARLLGALGGADAPVGPLDAMKKALVERGLAHREPAARRAAVAALQRMGAADAYEKIVARARGDSDASVRLQAMRAAIALRGDEALSLIEERLREDASPMVREDAAAHCGKRRLAATFDALRKALEDRAWNVSVVAAVSLGKIGDERALGPLQALAGDRDWRKRGAAAAGLGWLRNKRAVDTLVDLLTDKESAVRATALEFLRHVTGHDLPADARDVKRWWEERRERFTLADRKAEEEKERRYGYAVEDRLVYEDLDTIVLQTRGGGDNIQDLLTKLEIEHRLTRQSAVEDAELHPYAIFVANCPGEIVDDDAERISWFVRTGGYLFASCWALTHTVLKAFPEQAVVVKHETRQQVLDLVRAVPLLRDHPFLEGAFEDVPAPLFDLEGSHLPRVLNPERFEVLVDSPQCAANWGVGDLAGYFTVGHGLVLDSANHFDLQGMHQGHGPRKPLGTPAERMAWAMEHMGYDYGRVRELRARGAFASQAKAAEETRDVTMFRFITNFVRHKRKADE